MLIVTTPATSTALTTVARARAILGFATTDDAAALVLIGQASRAIVDYCRRPFAIETVRESFTCNDTRLDGPILGRGPVVEILSVRNSGDLIPPAEYAQDSRTGRLQRLDPYGSPLPWWGGGLIADYRAGYVLPKDDAGAPAPTLPESVERACIMLLSSYLSLRGRDPTVKTENSEGVGSTSWWVPGTSDRLASPEAAQLLADYVRFDA
ncbi:hypothetical protein [Methylobacterium sp. WL6]|uniref:hypothetical protein n=1 Tax=Methylobacterium sp. WL6 TaxID=2603901 RepID=UPI0011C7815E|nr:hypothetical protein [Methylobacterium sp. WL6]TXN71728.1 hypothetical protein FV230_07345 [Methylobacterium sp. WL6]